MPVSQYIACGSTNIAAMAMTAMVASDPTSENMNKLSSHEFIYLTQIVEIENVSNISKVSTNDGVDGSEWDGKEWNSEGETKLEKDQISDKSDQNMICQT